MHIFLSGVHGLGKTTFVNNYTREYPIIKCVNVDIVEPNEDQIAEQLNRIDVMNEVIHSLLGNTKTNSFVDRSPLDFPVYMNSKIGNTQNKDYKVLEKSYEDLINNFYLLDPVNILVVEDKDTVWSRIKKRGREKYNENDYEYFSEIYHSFYDETSKFMICNSRYSRFYVVEYDNLESIVTNFFGNKL